MGLKIGDPVTIKPGARNRVILEQQYHATIVEGGKNGQDLYWLQTGDAFDIVDGKKVPMTFGPFSGDHLWPGWVEA